MKKHSLQLSVALMFLIVLGMGMVAGQMDPDRKSKIFRTARAARHSARRMRELNYYPLLTP